MKAWSNFTQVEIRANRRVYHVVFAWFTLGLHPGLPAGLPPLHVGACALCFPQPGMWPSLLNYRPSWSFS